MKLKLKWIALFLILVLVLIFLILPSFKQSAETKIPAKSLYSDEPKDWVKEENNNISISVDESTKDKGAYFGGSIHYIDYDSNEYLMAINGYYEQKWFNRALIDNQTLLFKIGNEMNPMDNIPEFFSIIRKEKGNFVVYLFVDEDWKKESNGEINILWSENLSDYESFQSRKFNFEKENKGIYIDKISDNISWINESSRVGGIVIGEINADEFKENKQRKFFVVLR